MEDQYEHPLLLFVDHQLKELRYLIPILEYAIQCNKPLIIIADGFESEIQDAILLNVRNRKIKICAIRPPQQDDYYNPKSDQLKDLAILTGGEVIGTHAGLLEQSINTTVLGNAKMVKVTKDKTIIQGGGGDMEEINKRRDQLRYLIQEEKNEDNLLRLKKRLNRMSGSMANVLIPAATKAEGLLKIESAWSAYNAVKMSLDEGIIPGGGSALVQCSNILDNIAINEDQKMGISIVKQAIQIPLKSLCQNVTCNPTEVINHIIESQNPNISFDVTTRQYSEKIFDAHKIVRLQLKNSVSVACFYLSSQHDQEKDE